MAINTLHKHFHHRHKAKSTKQPIDKWIYLAVIAGPLFTIPQVYAVWFRDCSGVSMIAWLAYLVIAFVWLVYGIKHRELPIIIVQIVWIILDLLVVTGLIIEHGWTLLIFH